MKKYAKDLSTGDKVNLHGCGLFTVSYAERIHLTPNTALLFDGEDVPRIIDSHTLFEIA